MNNLHLRKADYSDVDLLFEWVNDHDVRMNSFNSDNIEYNNHTEWFKNCMNNNNIEIYIYYLYTEPIGQIRLNYENNKTTINYSVAKEHRGKGFGKTMLQMIESEIINSHPEINVLLGNIKFDNIASQKVFEHCGYSKDTIKENDSYYTYKKMIK